jgi:hypothetical protein
MNRRLVTILLLLLAPALPGAELFDRIAVTVGKEVVTLSEVKREIRLSAFQDEKPIDMSPAALRAAAEQIVKRILLTAEMEANRFSLVDRVDAQKALDQAKQRFPNTAAYEAALKKYEITEEDLLERIQSQLTVVSFIEFRFQTAEQPGPADVETYYKEKFVPLARQSGVQKVAPLEEVQDQIEQILAKERANTAISRFLERSQQRTPIRYYDGAFE